MREIALKARNYDHYRRLLHDQVLIAWVALIFTRGKTGYVHQDGDAGAMVTELLRLTHIGAHAEAAVLTDPEKTATAVIREATAWWDNQALWVLEHGARAS